MPITVIDTPADSAAAIMERDAALLRGLENNPQMLLHQYEWKSKALTYGHFIQPELFLRFDGLQRWGIDTARRPTGGGILFHTHDLAFSILIPAGHPNLTCNTLANYALVNSAVSRAIQQFCRIESSLTLLQASPEVVDPQERSFCMAHPTIYDVMVNGRKVGGAAQRRTRHGLLHQGSICLGLVPEECLRDVLAVDALVFEQMRLHSYPLLGTHQLSVAEIDEARVYLRCLLFTSFLDIA